MYPLIPATIWIVFCARWLDVTKAPADAHEWLDKGFLHVVPQGKLTGYVIALPGYRLVMGSVG